MIREEGKRTMSEDILTQNKLKRLLDYEPSTGVFTWKVTLGSRAIAGSTAGCKATNGGGKSYLVIRVHDILNGAHRLAWLHVNGSWPAHRIDHIDGNGTNNRSGNIREATYKEDTRNHRLQRNNTSGTCGVDWSHGKWRARISGANGKIIYLGVFIKKDDAIAARKVAEEKNGYSSGHGTQRPL